MKRSVIAAVAGLCVAAVCGCAPEAEQAQAPSGPAAAPRLPPGYLPAVGQEYSGAVPLGGRDVPLPPGEWRPVLANALGANGRVGLVQAFLERHSGATLSGLAHLASTVPGTASKLTGDDVNCTTSDVIENDVRAADPTGDLDCLTVNFASMTVLRSAAANTPAAAGPVTRTEASLFLRMFAQLDGLNLVVPATMVIGSVTLRRGPQELLAVVYTNPDLDHVPPDPTPSRATNGWAAVNLDKDPAKRAYVQRVRAETEAYRLRLLDAMALPQQQPDQPKIRTTSLDRGGAAPARAE